ncbi:hypothetical protein CCAX7_46600 [Capsulimonas corticalis]|uniref:Uncharacterized protein n=2 Tax=Capsulimonas corticalis TaxID=2219043 RepID=A0A402D4Z7_9BACT|nr:hypothetical protein CCAX7_46600 [Capsulimonas corticalis]
MTITPTGLPPVNTQIGNFDWCQILHTYVTTVLGITQASLASPPELDTIFPYNLPNQPFNDSPYVQAGLIANSVVPPMSIDFDATTYLMWNCGVSGAIWVPIDSLDWKAAGAESAGKLTSATQPTVSNPQNDTVVQPSWNDTFKL